MNLKDLSSSFIDMYETLSGERMDNIEIKEPLAGYVGDTHRWFYKFRNRVSFLSYYFRHDGEMIRPTSEVLDRLMNPEKKLTTID